MDVVPGDLAVVTSGETFPADGVIIDGSDIQADESSLTGESYAVRKRPHAEPPRTTEQPLAYEHWGFAGTRLLTGRASLLVAFTGAETIYGDIVRSARNMAHANTPLQRAVQRLVSTLVIASVAACVILVIARLVQGHGWLDAIISAVTLATAALPEEFPGNLCVLPRRRGVSAREAWGSGSSGGFSGEHRAGHHDLLGQDRHDDGRHPPIDTSGSRRRSDRCWSSRTRGNRVAPRQWRSDGRRRIRQA